MKSASEHFPNSKTPPNLLTKTSFEDSFDVLTRKRARSRHLLASLKSKHSPTSSLVA